jgi:hypothetical protein
MLMSVPPSSPSKPAECDLTGKGSDGKPCSTPPPAVGPAPLPRSSFTSFVPPPPYKPAVVYSPPPFSLPSPALAPLGSQVPSYGPPPVPAKVTCAIRGKTHDKFIPMDGCPHCATAEATTGVQTGLDQATLTRVEVNSPDGQVLAKKHDIKLVPRILHTNDDGTTELCQVSTNGEALCAKETVLYDCSAEEVADSQQP